MGNANIPGKEIAKGVGNAAVMAVLLDAFRNGVHEKGKEFVGIGFEKIQKKITEDKRAEMWVLVNVDLKKAGSDSIRASENFKRRQESRQERCKKTYPEGAPENERENYRYGDEDKMNELLTKLYMVLDGGLEISKSLGDVNKLLTKLLGAIENSPENKKIMLKMSGDLRNANLNLTKLLGAMDSGCKKREKMIEVFTDLGNKSDKDFDMALEALNHDALFQMLHKIWEDMRDVIGDAWEESIEPHVNEATKRMKEINEKLEKRRGKRWVLWSF